MLSQYQLRVGEIEKSRVESYSMLREQLGVLAETQRTLNTQTHQLVSALRRPQTRGQWGEITLKRLVELAGMSSHCDFCEQVTVEEKSDTENSRQRPDMIVSLPGERQIVIDCKAALDAFLDAAAAPEEDMRKVHLQRHCQQVRARSRELAQKSYWSQFARSPEFVVMFLPGEAFLYAAVEHDGSLIEDCLKNRVIVATPTTLIALLKAIEFGWRQEEVTQNAEEIRRHGKDLYERIAVLAGHFARLGANIDNVVGSYNAAIGSLESRVLVTARKISELGARTDKELPEPELIDSRPRELSAAVQALP
jgi:DNA recombination protein RmuC